MTRVNETRTNGRPRRARVGGSWWSALTRGGKLAVALVAVLAGGVLLAVVGDVAASAGRVHPGVRIGGVAVGSLTSVQAVDRLTSESKRRLATPVTVSYGSSSWKVTATGIGAKVDTFESVRRAMAVGHQGGLAAMISERVRALVGGGVSVPAKVDGDALESAALLDRIAKAVDVPARDASVSVNASAVRLIASAPGTALRRGPSGQAILSAFMNDDRVVKVVTAPVPVRVTDSDARRAVADAKILVSGSMTIVYGAQAHNVAKQDVSGWVAFRADPVDPRTGRAVVLKADASSSATAAVKAIVTTTPVDTAGRHILVAYLDAARVGGSVAAFAGKIGRPAIDAQFVTTSGRVSIKPSQGGQGADVVALAADLTSACLAGQPRTAVLRLTEVQPRLTTAQARAMGVADRLGTFTTTYGSGNAQRVNNVHLLATALNNKLVAPGAVFSFNGAAGERTAKKGYQEAPAIVDGKLVPQLGGGVCQVGTTIFNAVFFSGLPIIERRNHSFYISHYPKGRDCTVSWGGPDFKFKNDTPNWILIRTSFTNTSLTVSLYGTDPGYSVEYTTSDFTGVVPHKVKETKDPTLARGARLVEDFGVDGSNLTVIRTVYKGGQVVRTDTFMSHYNAKEEVVRVGTKAPSRPATGTPSP